ncbi:MULTISPECIES: MFS transporter [Chitinophagaceae]
MNIFGNNRLAAKVLTAKNSTPESPLTETKKRVRLAISLFYFFQGFCFASWASRIPYIKDHLGLTDGDMGSMLLALPLGQLVTMPVSGHLVKKFGSRRILILGAILYAIGLTNLGLAPNKYLLAIALFLFGSFGNLANIAVNTQGVNAERMYHRSIMASFHGAWSLAGFTGALVGLIMSNLHVGPYVHFCIVAVTSFISITANYKFLVEDISSKQADATEKKSRFKIPSGTILQLGIIGFFAMACEGAMFDWSGIYFKDIVHAPEGKETVGYACFMITMATGRFIGDRLITKLGRKRLMQICGVLIMAGLLLAVALPNFYVAALGFILVGFGVSTNIPNVYSVAGTQENISPSEALTAVSSISFLGFLMGPPLIGYTSSLFNLRFSYTLIAIFGLVITVMVTKLKAIK